MGIMARLERRHRIALSVLCVLLAGLLAFQAVVVVRSGEVGVLLTFERARCSALEPGLHFIVPGAQRVEIMRMSEIKKLVVAQDAATVLAPVQPSATGRGEPDEAARYVLTSDENLVLVDATIQYRIKDPCPYLFRAAEREELLRRLAEDALAKELLSNSVDDVLSQGRVQLLGKLRDRLREASAELDLGLTITSFLLGDVVPPRPALDAFQQVSDARADAKQVESRAQADAADKLAKARGETQRLHAEAGRYQDTTLAQARGDAARFDQLVPEFHKGPDVTRRRLSNEAQQRVLPGWTKLFFDQEHPPHVHLRP